MGGSVDTTRFGDNMAGGSSTQTQGTTMTPIDVGTQAPGFALSNQDGAIVNADDFSGRYVLLWWYPKASTPG